MRLAKIITTVGPATWEPDKLKELLAAGADIIRLNFSHGEYDRIQKIVTAVRATGKEMGKAIGLLADLQGPKIRVGELKDHQPITLEAGQLVKFRYSTDPGEPGLITTPIPQITEELRTGQRVLLDDGTIQLEVTERSSFHELICKVVIGGLLKEKKGINVPDIRLNIPALTEKDKRDTVFALQQEVDFIALSFVRSYQDVVDLRWFIEDHLPDKDKRPQIIAKIEKPQALEEIDSIIDAADGLMVARGDLGVELRPERVPSIQKMLIDKANIAEKPIITATQMLETMIDHASPTRAEVSDVANAVFDGTDALMLSGETAVGQYPLDTVRTMGRIIEEAESHYQEWHHHTERSNIDPWHFQRGRGSLQFHETIAQSAWFAAMNSQVDAIIVLSYSGSMCRRIAKRKPQCPIIALTPHETVYHQMTILWGVYPMLIPFCNTTEEAYTLAEEVILKRELLKKGTPVLFCAGKTHILEISNSIKIYLLGEILQQRQ